LACGQWEHELPDEPMPATDVADAYFNLMAERGEWFEIRAVVKARSNVYRGAGASVYQLAEA
jgi:hypothetical protein